jgi:hypothetical protein
MPWIGPFRLRDLLDRTGGFDQSLLHLGLGLYVFSLNSWEGEPTDLLYLGSGHATATTDLFYRIGNEVTSALGFNSRIVEAAGSGGILLSEYCRANAINPLDLRLGWRTLTGWCPVPEELALYRLHRNNRSPRLLNSQLPRCNLGCDRLG